MERPRYTSTNEVASELHLRERNLIAELRSTMLLRHTLLGLSVPNRLVIDLHEPTPPTEPGSQLPPQQQQPVDLNAYRRMQQGLMQSDALSMRVDDGYGQVLSPESIPSPTGTERQSAQEIWIERRRKMT